MKLNKSYHICAQLSRSMYLKGVLLVILSLTLRIAQAQQDTSPDFMRSVGKIYVVAAVTLVILLTLFIYMISIDRKITRLEKQRKNEQ